MNHLIAIFVPIAGLLLAIFCVDVAKFHLLIKRTLWGKNPINWERTKPFDCKPCLTVWASAGIYLTGFLVGEVPIKFDLLLIAGTLTLFFAILLYKLEK